jgi:2-oxoglutarate ferredoxin oxidoreductase subunit alpha
LISSGINGLKKLEKIKADSLAPEFIGNPKAKTLVVGWGTTYHPIVEALERINNKDIAFLHFKTGLPSAFNNNKISLRRKKKE